MGRTTSNSQYSEIDLGPLSSDDRAQVPGANKHVLWGWKRDRGTQKRAVFFSGDIGAVGGRLKLRRSFFCYWTVLSSENAEHVVSGLEKAEPLFSGITGGSSLKAQRVNGSVRVEFRFGSPTSNDSDLMRRLKLRRPRSSFPQPEFPPDQPLDASQEFLPADLYVGSGLSYEAGLPTLCDMHEIFGVDDVEQHDFALGDRDNLPAALANEGINRLKKFCRVHQMSIKACPTSAMYAIENLVNRGHVRKIFTDNVDNMLCKVGVPYERVRGSGVFNERYAARFQSRNLVVIGVAADRRQIIRQARYHGLHVIVVNPCEKVSPNVVHLDYLRGSDTFYRTTAEQFFANVLR